MNCQYRKAVSGIQQIIFFNALELNNAELVKLAIKDGADLAAKRRYNNIKGTSLLTPAIIAVERKNWEALYAIASSNRTHDIGNRFGFESALLIVIATPQESLAAAKQLSLAESLLPHIMVGKTGGIHLQVWTPVLFSSTKETALHTAARYNLPKMIALLLYHGYKDDRKNKDNQTAQQMNPACYLEGWKILQNNRKAAVISIVFIQASRQNNTDTLCHLSRLPFEVLDQIFQMAMDNFIINSNYHLENQVVRLKKISVQCFLEDPASYKTLLSHDLATTLQADIDNPDRISQHITNFIRHSSSAEQQHTARLLTKFHLLTGDCNYRLEESESYPILLLRQINVLMESYYSETFKNLVEVKLVEGQMIMIANNENDILVAMAYCTEIGLHPIRMNSLEMKLDHRKEIDFLIFTKCKMPRDTYAAFPNFELREQLTEQPASQPEKENCIIC